MEAPKDYEREDTSPPGVDRVRLGRDQAVRPWRLDPSRSGKRRYLCVCCGAYSLDCVDQCDICPECGWEDWYECHDAPERVIRPNYISLNDAKSIVAAIGPGAACAVNRERGLTRSELEAMTKEELVQLKGLDG